MHFRTVVNRLRWVPVVALLACGEIKDVYGSGDGDSSSGSIVNEGDSTGADTQTDADTNSDSDMDFADADTDTDTDADIDTDIDADTDSDTDSDSDADTDTFTETDTDANTDADTDADTNTDTYVDADTDSDSDADTASDSDSDTNSDSDAHADSNTGSGCDEIADPSQKGPLSAESYSSGLRNGPDYESQTMHYPTDGNPPFPAIAIVPGYLSSESSIADWGPYLASHGIVTLTISANSILDQPSDRSKALLDALETIRAENTRDDSPLNGKIDIERLAVMGWSMGGGGTLITVDSHPELKAAITLCAWNPGETYESNQVPTLLFAGTDDTLAGGQSQDFYTSIPESTPKMLFEAQGADHYFANTPSGASGQCGKYGTAWLKVFLDGDACYRSYLLEEPSGVSDFRTNLN